MEKVYILGTGTLALHCAAYAKEQGKKVLLFEMAEKKSMFLQVRAEKLKIPYFHEKKEKVFQRLMGEGKKTLLVSAINEFIIPGEVLKKQNITAINLHQALLPKHPGRNAECWAIFELDKVSGITWHYMETQVDAGDIIIQKEIPLSDDITSYELFQKQIQAAERAYDEIFQDLVEGKAIGRPQDKKEPVQYHKSFEVPNKGYLDLNWTGEKMSAFLRAMDYSILHVMKKPKLLYKNQVYQWKKYQISKTPSREEKMYVEGENITLQKNGIVIELKTSKCQ